MLSRVADAVYWLSRYIERADSTTRFVNVTEQLTLDLPGQRGHQWRALVTATGDDELFLDDGRRAFGRDQVMRFLIFDRDYPSSIWSCIRAARENARSVREIISADVWEQINRTYLFVQRATEKPDDVIADPELFLARLTQSCYAILGADRVTMSHDDAWLFMQLGRLLERADKSSRILDVKYFLLPSVESSRKAEEDLQWSALLQNVSALEMYHRRHGRVVPRKALDFLLFDEQFPRSVKFSITLAERALRSIEAGPGPYPRNEAERRVGRLRALLEFASVEEVLEEGVHEFVDRLQADLNAVGSAIQRIFFDLSPEAQEQQQSQS